MEKITYPLNIDKELWNRFKNLVPRTVKLNDALVELIEKKVLEAEGLNQTPNQTIKGVN